MGAGGGAREFLKPNFFFGATFVSAACALSVRVFKVCNNVSNCSMHIVLNPKLCALTPEYALWSYVGKYATASLKSSESPDIRYKIVLSASPGARRVGVLCELESGTFIVSPLESASI